jgi:hypothetical protein
MADLKISQLGAVSEVQGTDIMPVVSGNATMKASAAQLKSYVTGDLDKSDTAVAGSYVTAVTEADGVITVTREAADTQPTANSKKMLTSGGAKAALDAKQNNLTFDNEPTENSANPVKSGGVYAAEETLRTAIADEVKARSILGAKNLLPYPYNMTTKTNGGVTYTDLGDGTIKLTGTNTIENNTFIYDNITGEKLEELKSLGTLTLSGRNDTPRSNVFIDFYNENTFISSVSISENSIDFTIPAMATLMQVYNRCGSGAAYGVEGIIIKPMICLATDADSTHQPYSKTNQELTRDTNALPAMLNELGAKNELPCSLTEIKKLNTSGTWNGNSYTYRGVTYTVALDSYGFIKYISVNGTVDSNNDSYLNISKSYPKDKFVGKLLSGCTEGSPLTYVMNYVYRDSLDAWMAQGNQSDGEIVIPDYPNAYYIRIVFTCIKGNEINNLKIYPMIRDASISNNTYVPYAKTNRELTADVEGKTFQLAAGANINIVRQKCIALGSGLAFVYAYLSLTGSVAQGSVIASLPSDMKFDGETDLIGLNSSGAGDAVKCYCGNNSSDIQISLNHSSGEVVIISGMVPIKKG